MNTRKKTTRARGKEMIPITKFKDLKFPDKDLYIREMDNLEVTCNIKIYYRPDERGDYGFDFYVVDFVSVNADCKGDPFDDDSFEGQCLFYGHVYWDGLRHIYMGDKETDTENYLYYLDTVDASNIFLKLRELEKKHCSDFKRQEIAEIEADEYFYSKEIKTRKVKQ